MSFLRKTTISILLSVMCLCAFTLFVRADSDQDLRNFLETLITIKVIPSEKADLARTVLNSALNSASATSSTRITRDLKKGSVGEDVKLLQKVLNTSPLTVVASSGSGSAGNETTTFGPATEAAIIKFQNYYGFPPTGIVDGATKAKINALLSVVAYTDVPEADRPSVDLKVNGQDDKVEIGSGGTATIIWTSKNVTSCVSGGNKVKPVFGTETQTGVVSSGEFVITCVGPKGTVSDSVTMTVKRDSQQTANPTNVVTLGTTDPNATSTPYNPNNPVAKSLNVYVNGQKNYSTTSSSVSTPLVISWASTGFSACKINSNPAITNPADAPIPTGAIASGFATTTINPNSAGTVVFSVACAVGTSVSTLNQSSVSNLTSSANLWVSSATLNISNVNNPNNPTAAKSLNVYVNGVKNYYSATTSAVSKSNISWTSTGFTNCKITSNPAITTVFEKPVSTVGGVEITTSFTSKGTASSVFTVACATGTTALTDLNQSLVSNLTPSANIMIATSTLKIFYTTSTPSTPTPTAPTSTTITGPADTAKIIGYGPVNFWDTISASSLATQLSLAGLTVAEVELNVNPYDSNRLFSVTMPKLKAYVDEMRKKNIVTFIDIINGKLNDGEGDYICKSLFTDQYYTEILDYINQNIGTDKVILQPVSEWVGGCHDKRDRWINIFKTKWTGMKSYYVGSHSAPPSADWFKEYHASSITDYGNSGELVNTDGGNVLDALGIGGNGLAFADTAKLKAYACHVLLDKTKGFIYYGYGHTAIDSNAIIALGQLKANMPTSCDALEEVPEDGGSTIPFGGQVVSITECKNDGGTGGKLYAVTIQACSAGDMIGTSKQGAPMYGTGYITFKESQSLPSVGDSILGGEVPDEGGICEPASGSLDAPWIGDASGPFGTGPACINADGTPVNDPATDNSDSSSGSSSQFGTQTAQWAIIGGAVAGPVGLVAGTAFGFAIDVSNLATDIFGGF